MDFDLFVRFDSITIPQGSTIQSASISFKAHFSDTGTTVNTNIYGEHANDPLAVTSSADWDSRTKTAAVAWDNIPAWTADERSADTETPDISTIISDIVEESWWTSGEAMQFFVENDDSTSGKYRRSCTIDCTTHSDEVAKLTVTWTPANVAPTNDACDSDSIFMIDSYGWVNITVTDTDGVADLKEVEIQVNTTGDAETFTLNWTQSSNTFSEVSDSSGICTLDMETSTRVNIDSDTDKICFYFKFTNGATTGSCDVKATATDDQDATDIDTYSSEFVLGSGVYLNYPPDQADIGNSTTIDFKYTPEFYETIQNSSLWTNATGTWQSTQSNTTAVQNSAVNTITYTFSSDGVYVWNVQAWNSTVGIFAASNRTVVIESKYNFVDNNVSDVDSSEDKGTHSNFNNEKASDGNYDILTEECGALGSNSWQVSNGLDDAWLRHGTGGFINSTTAIYIGYATLPEIQACDGFFRWQDINVPQGATIDSAKFSFWCFASVGTALTKIRGFDEDDTANFENDPSGRDRTTAYVDYDVEPNVNMWTNITITAIVQEIINRAGWSSGNALGIEWADDGSGTGEINKNDVFGYEIGNNKYCKLYIEWSIPPYELDLEVQWTFCNYSRTYEELCIKTGTMNAEALIVEAWNGSAWHQVFANLTVENGWNNVSVSTYLTSATFTVRFLGGSESEDGTESTWQIDAALLHTREQTELSAGWNNFTAWSVDVGHTLGEINASIWNEGIQFTVISIYYYTNSTYYTFVRGYSVNANYEVVSTNDKIFVYCNATGGTWTHSYD